MDGEPSLPTSKADKWVSPSTRFFGACNVETVKDVNYLGRFDEYVTSGSDDGNFFIWCKRTGRIVNILEGDGSVVNVVEQNPHFDCVAVSGIDHSVKIFGRGADGPPIYSRVAESHSIIQANTQRPSRYLSHRADILHMIAQYRLAVTDDGGDHDGQPTCVYQ